MTAQATRLEHDSLGERAIPASAYYGVQTLRAVENFPISGIPLSAYPEFINALAIVKKACALANHDLHNLESAKKDAIVGACDEILDGKLHEQFPVDMIQGGADDDGSDSVSTAFAVLFLRRKFQKVLPAVTPGGGMSIVQLGDNSTSEEIDEVVQSTVVRGRDALPQVLRALRSTVKNQRVAAGKALAAIAGEDFVYDPQVPAEKSQEAVKKAELWRLRSRSGGR